MGAEVGDTQGSWASRAIAPGKDLVALLRDAALLLLAVLLVAFPAQFNTMLVEAGFEEGSVVGFKWKSKLVESNNALEDAQATIADLQKTNDDLLKALEDTNKRLNDPVLEKRVTVLAGENREQRDATQQVQATVSRAIQSNVLLVEKARASSVQLQMPLRAKDEYAVGLQTLGLSEAEHDELNQKLRTEGYGLDRLTHAYGNGQRPSWFATRSTVFFYAASAQPAAQQLAQYLKSTTGADFAVQRGSGLGVESGRKDVTLFVHYIRG